MFPTFAALPHFSSHLRHTALVPTYLAANYRPHGVFHNARSILAIHNLCHQVCGGVGGVWNSQKVLSGVWNRAGSGILQML